MATTATAQPTLALTGAPSLSQDSTVCRHCNTLIDKSKKGYKRIIYKSGPRYVCSRCNSKNVILYNQFGQWPIEEFRGFTEEQQQNFYNNTENSKRSLKSRLTDLMVKKLIEQKTSALSGEFLPLSVWEKKGWDPKQIEEGAQEDDKEWHAQAGWTYRVKIHITDERKIEQESREMVMNMLQRYRPKAGADRGEADKNKTEVDSPNSASSSSAGSESSCTSSSSAYKRSKKGKRTHKKENNKKNKKREKKEKKEKHKKGKKESKPSKDKKTIKVPISSGSSESSTAKEIRKKKAEKEAKKRKREAEKEEASRKREEERMKRKAEADAEAKKKNKARRMKHSARRRWLASLLCCRSWSSLRRRHNSVRFQLP